LSYQLLQIDNYRTQSDNYRLSLEQELKMHEPESLAREYLASEREYLSLQTQYERAIRDAFLAGYRSAVEAEVIASKAKHKNRLEQLEIRNAVTTKQATNRILRIKEVMQRLGVSRGTVYQLERGKSFPRKIRITPHAVGWREEDIERWIADQTG
jgi:prophage regulatory protein